MRSLSLRPGNSLTILLMASSMGFRRSVSLPPAIQATGLLALAPAGLTPLLNTFAFLWTHAKPYRFRVRADAEGFPVIPGRYGKIEWHCDGVNCSSCALPGRFAIAAHSSRPRLFAKLWAIPGVQRHQTGDREMRAVFPAEALEQVADVIKARRRRTLTPEEARWRGFKPTHRTTSRG